MGRGYRREDLPEEIVRRHSPLKDKDFQTIQALRDHSEPILDGIRSTIGGVHLTRRSLVQQILDQVDSNQIVLITGSAGSGKSVLAKDILGTLKDNYFVFGFRSEEFARPHLDETLQVAQTSANFVRLRSVLAGQDQKVILIESVERLLEHTTRDAFDDFLSLFGKDDSWRLLLTCRDYSTNLVLSAFLQARSVSHGIVTVPPLNSEELNEVIETHPALSYPLANPALCRLLSNPYYLDWALKIDWSEGGPMPQNERELRQLFWREIVRVDHHPGGGNPQLRETFFLKIALNRAQKMTPYVPSEEFDPKVVGELLHDSLLVSPDQSTAFVAPAHDVLEDWAILHWLNLQYMIHEDSIRELSASIGTHPAVRRTFRKWVTELVEVDSKAADQLFMGIVNEGGIDAHFCDDTLISFLRSSFSTTFLERHAYELTKNDCKLLRRVIHLLRVACVATNEWLGTTAPTVSVLSVPDGQAWASILELVQGNLPNLAQEYGILLLELIEDWARGVSIQEPYPKGSEAVAEIAHRLLPEFEGYGSEGNRKRILQIIAKIPNADLRRFEELMLGHGDTEDYRSKELRKVVFEGFLDTPAARDTPSLVASSAKDYLLCKNEDLDLKLGRLSPFGLEILFGVKGARSHGFAPVSAFRGPFLPLLQHHRREGLDLIIDFFNHSADWYSHPRIHRESVEPPFEISLTFPDGRSRIQWCNDRLWKLYRGTSVGPDVLQCILMALEHWLLDQAKNIPETLDGLLLDILSHSETAALTATVASVATAFPHLAGETLLVLLRSRVCIELDYQRFAKESQASLATGGYFPGINAYDEFFIKERKESNELPHRQVHLEQVILKLQWVSQSDQLVSRIHEALDLHYQAMPPAERRTPEDRTWLKALYCMDSRMFRIHSDLAELPETFPDRTSHEDGAYYIYPDFEKFEPDIREMVTQSTATLQTIDKKAGLLNWGIHHYEGASGIGDDSSQWKNNLQEAREFTVDNDISEDYFHFRDSQGFIAAVCVRDHWEEMSHDEKGWCVDTICFEVEREANNWHEFASMQVNGLSADRPCAYILPCLLGKSLSKAQQDRIHRVLVLALTHANFEVRNYASSGIGNHLWEIKRSLALKCANALATEAILVQHEYDKNRKSFFSRHWNFYQALANAARAVRKRFGNLDLVTDNPLRRYDPTKKFQMRTYKDILNILRPAPHEPSAVEQFVRLAKTLVRWWNSDASGSGERDYDLEAELGQLIPSLLLQTSLDAATLILQPFLDSIDSHPDKIHWIMRGIIRIEDRQPNKEHFWLLWEQFAIRVRVARWVAGLDKEYSTGREMMSAMFLGAPGEASARHRRSLEGFERHIQCLFDDLPLSSTVVDYYVRFLFQIGERLLPDAFVNLKKKISEVDQPSISLKGNTVFHLEILLQRFVYRRPLELKSRRDLKEAVLFLLDHLVENGSSSAFRMRDDFVTPVPPTP